jgi:hypothetical protein
MRIVFIFLILISTTSYGQWKDYIIGIKGDTLNRVDMKGRKQGPWVVTFPELRGERGYEEEGYFENDKKTGTWKVYSLMGDKMAVENYRWGNKDGRSQYYTIGGAVVREESWKAVNPENPWDTVDVNDPDNPSRVLKTVIVKLEGFSLKHGLWTYFDPLYGTVTKEEKYFLDKPGDGNPNNDLKPIDVSTGYKPTIDSVGNKVTKKTPEMLEYEKKNAGKKSIKVRDCKTGY